MCFYGNWPAGIEKLTSLPRALPSLRRSFPNDINRNYHRATRRLAYEAADSGVLSPDLATRIRRVKERRNTASGSAIG
jgi:hypothetical protein